MFYQRKRTRIPVQIPVTITTVLDSFDGTIVDLTEDGARIACPGLPRGERIQIEYRGQTVFARCMWGEIDRIGVTFPFPLSDGPLFDQLQMARAAIPPVGARPSSFPLQSCTGFGRRTAAR